MKIRKIKWKWNDKISYCSSCLFHFWYSWSSLVFGQRTNWWNTFPLLSLFLPIEATLNVSRLRRRQRCGRNVSRISHRDFDDEITKTITFENYILHQFGRESCTCKLSLGFIDMHYFNSRATGTSDRYVHVLEGLKNGINLHFIIWNHGTWMD